MGKVIWSAPSGRVDTLANYKQWIQAMHDGILASGMLQSDDSGQLEITGITGIPSIGQYSGYLIYKMADSLASDYPVYIKLRPYVGQYGGSSYLAGNVAASVGTSTDGQGNITGVRTSEFNFYNSGSGNARQYAESDTPSFAIHTEGRFSLVLGARAYKNDHGNYCQIYLDITRFLDIDGQPSAAGVVITRNGSPFTPLNNTAGSDTNVITRTTLSSVAEPDIKTLTPFMGGVHAGGGEGRTIIQRTHRMAPVLTADPSLVMYWDANIPFGDEFDVAVDGRSRHYYAVGNALGASPDIASGLKNVGFGILWGDL